LLGFVDEREMPLVSGWSSITLKKRSAATAALMVGGLTPVSVRCTWNARNSSAVAVSEVLPRKAASLL
jgi:hypothetical protein